MGGNLSGFTDVDFKFPPGNSPGGQSIKIQVTTERHTDRTSSVQQGNYTNSKKKKKKKAFQ